MNMKNERILESQKYGGAEIQIVEMSKLLGGRNAHMAQNLVFMEQAGITEKFVRIILNNSQVTTESGAFYYSKGNIENQVNMGGATGLLGKAIKGSLTGEKSINPVYKGTGEVVLEPSFGYYAIYPMENEEIIVDKGLYYCHVGNITVSAALQQSVSAGLAGGEGLFQTKISGSGLVVLAIPVPLEELVVFQLENERCQVDGNFAILRESSIRFTVTKSTKGLIGSAMSGEGFLNTFEGTGQVWLAPTAPTYNRLAYGGMSAVNSMAGSSNNMQ